MIQFAQAIDENSASHASTLEDFYSALEPSAPQPQDELAEMLGLLFDSVFPTVKYSKCRTPEELRMRLESGYRKFCACVWLVRPQSISPDGVQGWRMAEALSITRAAFSKLAVGWSDELGGMRNGSMRTATARRTYSESGGAGAGSRNAKRKAGHIGDGGRKDEAHRACQDHAISEALQVFGTGERTWTTKEFHALLDAGLVDEEARLTDAGKQRLEALPLPPPAKGTPATDS